MRRAGIRAHAIGNTKTLRDSASQISRATLGLREMLLRGAFAPGQRIAEIPLSAKLGVSRTPLRLAFEKLEHEGLIKALPHSGFAANEFSVDRYLGRDRDPGHPGRRCRQARGRTFEESRSTGTVAQDQSRHGRSFRGWTSKVFTVSISI